MLACRRFGTSFTDRLSCGGGWCGEDSTHGVSVRARVTPRGVGWGATGSRSRAGCRGRCGGPPSSWMVARRWRSRSLGAPPGCRVPVSLVFLGAQLLANVGAGCSRRHQRVAMRILPRVRTAVDLARLGQDGWVLSSTDCTPALTLVSRSSLPRLPRLPLSPNAGALCGRVMSSACATAAATVSTSTDRLGPCG